MRTQTTYGWVVEPIDKHDDIIDPLYFDSFNDALKLYHSHGFTQAVKTNFGLVKYLGNDEDGEIDRTYAYMLNGELPEIFEDYSIIPGKFRKMALDQLEPK